MIKKIYYIILLLLSIISIYLGFNSTIIPNKILYLIIIAYIIFLLLAIIFITRKNKLLITLGIILTLPIIIGNVGLSYLYIRSNDFFNNISNIKYEKINYLVLVTKESNVSTLEDLKNIGIYKSDTDKNYDKSVQELNKKIKLEQTEYNNIIDIINDLYNSKIESMMINEIYLDIMEEIDDKFDDNTKIIDTITIESIVTDNSNEVNIAKLENFNIYISGIDTYGPINTVSRSDVNILATVNLKEHKILLTNTPRDYFVQLRGTEGLKDKLTHAGYYGINTSVGTIEDLYNTKINYYIRVNFNTLITIVDKIGGIDIYSEEAIYTSSRTYIRQGWNHLNGKQALAFARERKSLVGGDKTRGKNQQKVIEAIFSKVTKNNDINSYLNLLNTLENSIQTNMNKKIINGLINLQVKNNYSWSFDTISVDGNGSEDYTYSYPYQKLWIMIPNEETVETAKKTIKEYLNN